MVGALGLGNQLRTCAIRQASRRQRRRWSTVNPTVLNAQGYQKEIIKEGSGPTPTQGQKVSFRMKTPVDRALHLNIYHKYLKNI